MRSVFLTVVAVVVTVARLGAQAQASPKPTVPSTAQGGAATPAQPSVAPAPAAQPPATTPSAPATTSPTPAPPAGAAASPEAQPEPYTYNAEGRRDPFTSLIGTGGESSGSSRRGDGPGGIAVADVSVRGVLQSRGTLVAMIQGPDNKTYIVHQGDKLLDGVIKTITPQGLIVTQEVNDPLSLVKQREVSKLLRSLEVVKP